MEEACGTTSFAPKQRRVWPKILSSAAAMLAVCILVLNLVPGAAQAASRLPLLGSLAKAFTFLPSQQACVEQDYLQVVDKTYSENGFTTTVDYMILDETQLCVFYSVDLAEGQGLFTNGFRLLDQNGKKLPTEGGFIGSAQGFVTDSMYVAVFGLPEGTDMLPEQATLQLDVEKGTYFDEDQHMEDITSATLSLPLTIDKANVFQPEIIPVGKELSLKGQTVTIESLEIHPTQTYVNLSAAENNSAYLTDLEIYLQDRDGNIYGRHSMGSAAKFDIITLPNGDSAYDLCQLYLESCYFAPKDGLTLHIESMKMVEKDQQFGKVSYANNTVENLPAGVTLGSMVKVGDDLTLELLVETRSPENLYCVAMEYPLDPNERTFGNWTDGPEGFPGFATQCCIHNYQEGESTVKFIDSGEILLDEPIVLKLG